MNLTRRQLVLAGGATALALPAHAILAKDDVTSPKMVLSDPDAPVLGNPRGDVTIVEYFDYQCPYCKKSYSMVRDVVEKDGRVKLVMKDWPVFGGASIMAAQAVLASAKIGKYEKTLDAMMHTPVKLEREDIEKTLKKVGLSFDSVGKIVAKHQLWIAGLLDRNWIQATAFNFVGTPSFVVGTTAYPGVLDRKGLTEAISKARG